ncbi:MAG: hypothetical protein Q9228_003820 [Teloschistes exilis]
MAVFVGIDVLLLWIVYSLAVNVSASPILIANSPALVANITRASVLAQHVGYFPPGPPNEHFLYIIPDTDLGVELFPLGLIPHRDEAVVRKVISDAIHDSINYRINAKISVQGYKKQEDGFLLSVSHSVGRLEFTWGMWTIVLTGLNGYVQAYPGYDFQFTIRKYLPADIAGYVIGSGFAKTR